MGKSRSGLGYPGALIVARAAVKAKQQAAAKAAPTKARAHGRRRGASGGNPNQDLFFMRLRRRQKWVYAALALVFAITFVAVGVGSGSNGLSGLFSGIFSSNGDPVGKARAEIKTNPVKGYRDLATAYQQTGNLAGAIGALQSYVALKKKDANAWNQLGGYELTQAGRAAAQYQSAQQASTLANPTTAFIPPGKLGQALGTDPVYQQSSQAINARAGRLYSEATGDYSAGLHAYQQTAKLQPKNADAWSQVGLAATDSGQYSTAIKAYKKFLELAPTSPVRSQVEQRIKQLQAALHPAPQKK